MANTPIQETVKDMPPNIKAINLYDGGSARPMYTPTYLPGTGILPKGIADADYIDSYKNLSKAFFPADNAAQHRLTDELTGDNIRFNLLVVPELHVLSKHGQVLVLNDPATGYSDSYGGEITPDPNFKGYPSDQGVTFDIQYALFNDTGSFDDNPAVATPSQDWKSLLKAGTTLDFSRPQVVYMSGLTDDIELPLGTALVISVLFTKGPPADYSYADICGKIGVSVHIIQSWFRS